MAGIVHADYYLPERFMTVKEVLANSPGLRLQPGESLDAFCETFSQQSGLRRISIGDSKEALPVFAKLLRTFFEKSAVSPGDIAYIVVTDPDNIFHSKTVNTASCLQIEFGMSSATIVYLRQGCAGTLMALGMLNRLLTKERRYGLVLSSSFAPSMERRFLTYSMWGDAQGIAVVGFGEPSFEIVDWNARSDGSTSYANFTNSPPPFTSADRIVMTKRGVEVMRELLARNHLTFSDLAMVIPQITHYVTYASVYAGLMGVPRDRIFLDNMSAGGHTADVDIIRNVHDVLEKRPPAKGSYFMLYGIGIENVDAAYQSILVRAN